MIKDKEEARIFSWIMDVEVVSLKEEIEKASIKLFGIRLEDLPKEEREKTI